jgi:hypothetical protein
MRGIQITTLRKCLQKRASSSTLKSDASSYTEGPAFSLSDLPNIISRAFVDNYKFHFQLQVEYGGTGVKGNKPPPPKKKKKNLVLTISTKFHSNPSGNLGGEICGRYMQPTIMRVHRHGDYV